MRWVVLGLTLWMGSALGQESVPIAQIRFVEQDATQTRLSRLIGRLARVPGAGSEIVFDPSAGTYTSVGDIEPPKGDRQISIEIDVNAWRGVVPDAFEPGPMNAILGVVGIADARAIVLSIDKGGRSLTASWDRRREDPATAPMYDRVLASRNEQGSELCEVWRFDGLGLGMFITGAYRSGLALEPGQRAPSDWAMWDFWLRARSSLLRSLDSSTVRAELAITADLRSALVFRFDPAVKPESLERAASRIVPDGVAAITIGGRSVSPQYVIAQDGDVAVVVVAPTRSDLEGVLSALGLSEFSGRDGP